MERTQAAPAPTMTRKPKPMSRTKAPQLVGDQLHIPGFVRGLPEYCEAPVHNRNGIKCVDVITCCAYCSRTDRKTCPAHSAHLVAAELLQQEKL